MGPAEPPVPPEALRQRVHGATDLASFQLVGSIVSSDILKAIETRVTSTPGSHILDFGCGCGRIITYFRRASAAELYACDIDGEAIAWCRENLSDIAHFEQTMSSPPLPFADGFFDFVYSISVFTHLPEPMQMDWLAELRRITKPGGYVLLTTHGPHLLSPVSDPVAIWSSPGRWLSTSVGRLKAATRLRRLRDAGFFYLRHGTEGLPKFYGVSFHTHEGIRSRMGRFFEVETITHKGIANYQDLVLCRRPH